MAKDRYYINEDIDYGYAESKVRTSIHVGETEEDAARRVLDSRLLEIWLSGKTEEAKAIS